MFDPPREPNGAIHKAGDTTTDPSPAREPPAAATKSNTDVDAGPRHATNNQRIGRLLLVIVDGPDRGKRHSVEVSRGRVVKAGRNDTNELVIRDDAVSGTHFELRFEDAGICLRDLGSTNGVYIHGTRIREALLDLDAVFRVGSTAIKLVSTATVSVPMSDNSHFGELHGDSPIMREVFADLERVAALTERLTVLITGETGTGKELVARGLHEASARAAGPFVVLDCTSLPRELAESFIFGHTTGAFTGAVRDHHGVFEQAHGGTLFIDELGELPLELQAKLLRPLERGEVVRLSDTIVRKVNVRVIAATHRDLRLMMSQGRFREDLYFRLAVKTIEIPALRERGADIVLLARRFLSTICQRNDLPAKTLTPAACEALQRSAWPGNVRQLKAIIERTALTTTNQAIEPTDLDLDDHGEPPGASLDMGSTLRLPVARAKEAFERVYYQALLKHVGVGRKWAVHGAKLAGLDRTGFIKALRRLELYPDHYVELFEY
jgi:DNA-binding NtrC family response regulator